MSGAFWWCSLVVNGEVAAPVHTVLGLSVNLKLFEEVLSLVRDATLRACRC